MTLALYGWRQNSIEAGELAMANEAKIYSRMLRGGQRAIAESVYAELHSEIFDGEVRSGSGEQIRFDKRADAIQQTENDLDVLAACIAFSSPTNWQDHVRWLSKLAQTVSPLRQDLRRYLKTLSRETVSQLSLDSSNVIAKFFDQAIESLRKGGLEKTVASNTGLNECVQHQYLVSLLASRRNAAMKTVLDAIDSGASLESIYLNIIQPAQRELGRRWQAGEISVAQEHYCTAATQFVMSQLQPYFSKDNSSGNTLVAICVGDELHEVGLRIVADLFEVNGWNSVYLGANTPAKCVAEILVSSGAQVLAVSATMTQHLFSVADVIGVVRSHPDCQGVKILVGGYPFNVDPFLWKRVGADGYAIDAPKAILVANRLVGSEGQQVSEHQPPSGPEPAAEVPNEGLGETNEELSRLSNKLITFQRDLHKANVKLAALNKANQQKTEALERADRRKDEFLAMLAHELRGPLAPMELAVGLLQMEDLEPTDVAQASQTLKRQLHQMAHLINDLLDASRVAYGKIDLQVETLDLEDVVRRATEIVLPLVQDKQQTLFVDFPSTPIALEGDEIRLTQIIANLLTNSAKYTDSHGSIWLSAKRVQDTVVIEVKDNGVGMEPDLLSDVFSVFTQEKRSRKHSMGGMGIGLSLVKQLVNFHGGTVKAASDGPGLGSLFSVSLPCLETGEEGVSTEIYEIEDPKTLAPPRRVLIVEDADGLAKITAVLFKKLGHLPEIANDGDSAIKMYEEFRPDIVVLDLDLPDMSGLEVSREIRQRDPNDATLIVALTGHGEDKHRRMALESGCDIYFVKPTGVREFKQLIVHPKLVTVNN